MTIGVCGSANVDTGHTCELAPGHGQLWRYGAWQDHGAPSANTYWTTPPYTDEDIETVVKAAKLVGLNRHLADVLAEHLGALGYSLTPTRPDPAPKTQLIPAVRPDLPEYRALGYTVEEAPRGMY